MPPPIPKPIKAERKRKPMNKIGKVGRAKLDIVAELTEQATREGNFLWLLLATRAIIRVHV